MTGFMVWLLVAAPCRASDDYLSELEAEADDTAGRGALTAPQAPGRVAKPAVGIVHRGALESGLTHAGFEAALETHYSGTYFLYVKLDRDQRRAVFNLYRLDRQIEAVREEIVRQLSSG